MIAIETAIPGCVEIQPLIVDDLRGRFVKVIDPVAFAKLGLESAFVEQYYSHSTHGVLRGLHFQIPPHDHVKLYCVRGSAMDVAVDLRVGSPSYGRHIVVELSEEQGNALYLPRGLAHGFYATSPRTTMLYNVTSAYSPASDSGVRWDSVGVRWPEPAPVMSSRDRSFSTLVEIQSPFTYQPARVDGTRG
jgi:dTDP-4-dehydrorhamnose 3,5-epimerase